MKEKAEFNYLKDSARPVLRLFRPANAVYILSRRTYEHFEFIFNAEEANVVIFTQPRPIDEISTDLNFG